MYYFFKINRIAILLMLIFFQTSIKADKPELSVEWLIPSVVTNTQLIHFDFTGSGSGPTLFKITVDNTDGKDLINLKITYKLSINIDARSGSDEVAYKGYTEDFDIKAGKTNKVLSNDFLQEINPDQINLKYKEQSFDDSEISHLVYNTGTMPTGVLSMSLILKENGSPIDSVNTLVTVLNPSQLDLISPGTESEDGFNIPEYTDPVLHFNWSSDLTANMYNENSSSKDVFILQIFKKGTGQSRDEVLSQQPIFTRNLREPFYSLLAPEELERGAVYYWRVIGVLKGLLDGTIVSSPFVFRYADIPNPEISELKEILKNILSMGGRGDPIPMVDEFDKEIRLSKEGAPLSLEYLKKLEQDMIQRNQKLTSVTVE